MTAEPTIRRRGGRRGAGEHAVAVFAGLFIGLLFVSGGGVLGSEGVHSATCTHDEHGMCSEDEVSDFHGAGRSLLSSCDPAVTCSGNGACVTDAGSGLTSCDCFTGYSPPSCNEVVDCAPLGWCNQRGICVKGGICACDPGWDGAGCTMAMCPQNCNGHGACNSTNRMCMCDPGWSGRACSIQGCIGNCSDHGVCVDGDCECDPGYEGANCEDFVCINECSGHGSCSQALGRCECSPWFTGEDCGTPLCPSNCSGHGSCVNGECICDSGWSASDCSSHLCPQACSLRGTCQSDGVCICQTGFSGDACQLSTTCEVYDCSGHGTCRFDSGQSLRNASCDCDPGWSGGGCEMEIAALTQVPCLNNCSSHGSCVAGVCVCDGGWDGPDCSAQVGGCPGDCSGQGSCVNGTCACDVGFTGDDCFMPDSTVLCAANCSSGVGVFRNGSCVCSPVGTLGGGPAAPCPLNCSDRGSCVNGTCFCDAGFGGPGCEAEAAAGGGAGACVNNCSGHGACFNGTCACDAAWGGGDCSAPLGQGGGGGPGCPGNCSGRGACMEDGSCACDPGFLGPDCGIDALDAPPCAANCSGRGMCINSTCLCEPGYAGSWCEALSAPGATPVPGGNRSEDARECPVGGGGEVCSGRGSCVGGACVCDAFWRGAACGERVARLIADCPGDCSNRGTCLNGTCMCDPMWDGIDCSYPSACPGLTAGGGGGNCTGHGACVNGTCLCDPAWSGVDCSIEACPDKCSGHGICANSTCHCDLGWTGRTCDEPGCPADCSGHGSCGVEAATGRPTCACEAGWMGAGCGDPRCPTDFEHSNPYVPCSGNGACFQDGTCTCYENYEGADCSILNDCSGRGVRRCGFCVCEEGYEGDLCQVDVCEDSRLFDPEDPGNYSASTVCSGRGRCTTLQGCVCEAGWAGRNCSDAAVCESTCEERNGQCFGSRDDPGTCECGRYDIPDTVHDSLEWTGRYCTFRQCPGYRGIDSGGSPIVCSGKGLCDEGLFQCSCFNVQGEGPYTGIDCGVPPLYKITTITPKVGPLEGGTLVSVVGPGLERLLPLVAPKVVYCDFGTDIRYPAVVSDFPDILICTSPPVSQATPEGVRLTLTDADGGALEEFYESLATFEYFAHPRIVRLTPSYGPLRPQGGPNELRGPSSTNQPNMVTVTGTYFPPNGNYRCSYGGCEAGASGSIWVDTATVVCVMPQLAEPGRVQISISANAQQYMLPQQGTAGQFSVFGINSVSPQCGSSNGDAMLTVRGDLIVDPDDSTRNLNEMYCRFGRVTLSGKTKLGIDYQSGFKLFAFHSKAVLSERAPGALECKVPDWPIETSDFALTLEGTFVQSDPETGDGYYHGQWDATPSITFDSFYQPEILLLPGPGNQMLPHPYIVEPTLGPVQGGTRVTVAGLGFDFARYGPNTGNNLYPAWSPSKPLCNKEPIPSCKFGTTVTRRVEILNNETLVCITPVLPEPIESTQTVVIEVALDGQTYSTASPSIQYTFHPEHRVTSFYPSAGVRTGGTVITVRGEAFVDSDIGDVENNRAAPKVLTCVFISVDSPSIRYVSQSTRFLSPEEITCVSPSIPAPAEFLLDVSLSGQIADSQLSGSGIRYVFYQDPSITNLRDDVGSVYGGEVVAVEGESFVNLETLFCRFGDVVVPGTLVAGSIECVSPPSDEPKTVDVEVTLNGIDYSVTVPPKRYTFFDLVSVEPSSGPIHGGTFIYATIAGGPDMTFFKPNGAARFNIQGRVGDIEEAVFSGVYDAATGRIEFSPPRDALTDSFKRVAFEATGELPFRISLTATRRFAAFPGRNFILYDATFQSVLPCASGNCRDLALPKSGLEYPVTFTGAGLVGVDSIKCGYVPLGASEPAGGAAATFAAFQQGAQPAVVYDGTFDPVARQVYCKSPPLQPDDAQEGWAAAVALNGQNFVGRDFSDETFSLVYLPQPEVTALSVSAGQATGGMMLTVTGSSWNYPSWFRGGAPPATLSCLFFLPSQGTFKFSQATDPQCSGSPAVCTAVCETPEFASSTAYGEGSLVRAQVFMSLNRRDPCMRCGCLSSVGAVPGLEGFGRADCSGDASDDADTMLSRFDAETMGFCSESYMVLANAHFCKGRSKCPLRDPLQESGASPVINIDDTEFKCLTTDVYQGFVFYARPRVRSIAPLSVGGPEVSNKSATDAGAVVMRLNGDFLAGSQWLTWPALGWPAGGGALPVRVRATYMDLHNFTLEVQGTFTAGDPSSADPAARQHALGVRLPMPCVDIQVTSNLVPGQPLQYSPPLTNAELEQCFAHTGVRLNQTRDRMVVAFEVSFNGGVQFAEVAQKLSVYKDRQCPDEGCGHGECVFYDQLPPTNPAYPVARLPNGNARVRVRTCFCGFWPVGQPECATGANSIDQLNVLYSTGYKPCKENILWYDASLDTGNLVSDPQKMYTLWDMWGRAGIWPHHDSGKFNPQELGCSAGPKVEGMSPGYGALVGGTRVELRLLLSGTSWDVYTQGTRTAGLATGLEMPQPLEDWFRCIFTTSVGATLQVDPERVRFSDGGTVAEYACVTPALSSFVPAPEGNTDVRLDVTYVNGKGVASPLMFEGGFTFRYRPPPVVDRVLMDVGGTHVPARSIPICVGECTNDVPFNIVLEGSGFFDTPELVCRINGQRVVANYISPTMVSCSLIPAAGGGGRRQVNGTSASTITVAGRYLVEVSVNALRDTDNEFVPAGEVDFFDQPEVVKDDASGFSFGVDPSLVGTTVSSVLGSADCGTQCNTRPNEYAQLGPTSGGTPLVFYLREPAASSRVGEWDQRRNITLLFGECEPSCPPGTPEDERFGFQCNAPVKCSCRGDLTAPVSRSQTQSGGGVNFQLFKLASASPGNVTRTGRYLMCLSMNGVHFLPMRYRVESSLRPFYWRYHETHRVRKLSLTDGPINIPFLTYNLEIHGDNFPVKPVPPVPNCDWVEVGVCEDFAPRVFVYVGAAGTTVGGYGSLGQLTPLAFSSPVLNVSSGVISMVMPDMSVISADDFVANITVSFNGYDFSPVRAGVTEFSFYRIPTVSRQLSPSWGHYDQSTLVTIFGQDFQPTPGRSKCRVSSCSGACDAEGPVQTMVEATFVSSTQMVCELVARPPFEPTDEVPRDTSRRVYVSFTPDGRPSIQRQNPVMYEKLMSPVGRFQYTNEIRFMNVSARAAPTSGGTAMTLVVINHRDAHVDTGQVQVGDKACLDMTGIDTLVIGLLPTSSSVWKIVRPTGYLDYIPATITDRRFEFVSVVVGNFEQGFCYMYIDVELPFIPYPLEADLKVSFDRGQHFTGPSTPMVFYNPSPPESNIPSRGARASAVRPQLTVYFDNTLFQGANPEFSVAQTVLAFTPTPACEPIARGGAPGVCAMGPMCRFTTPSGEVRTVPATFTYDPFQSLVRCTAPAFDASALAQVSVSLDGSTFLAGAATTFLFFDVPVVDLVLPTTGFWDSRTNLLLSGRGFLAAEGDTHLIWCLFDFRDVLPAGDAWDVPRRWTRAYILPDGNSTLVQCASPVIEEGERPTTILPRARVGVIIDGICQDQDPRGQCTLLKNSDSVIVSDAFFIYANVPTITEARPKAALSVGGSTFVTISGMGFMDQYTWGPPAVWNQQTLPLGFEQRPIEKLCLGAAALKDPAVCPGLSCRFGQACPVDGLGVCTDRIVDGVLDANGDVLCPSPEVEGGGHTVVGVSVSLNGDPNEFSNELDYIFTSLRVVGPLVPSFGTAFGGGQVTVSGEQFVNVTCPPGTTSDCLTCRFTSYAPWQPNYAPGMKTDVLVAAVYVSDTKVTCEVPGTDAFGQPPEDVQEDQTCGDQCNVYVSVSVNSWDFVPAARDETVIYRYIKTVEFARFSPSAGPITGDTNVTVQGSGFSPNMDIWCKVGDQVVMSRYVDDTRIICQVPAVAQAVQGGVFVGFSTNGADYCELVPQGNDVECVFTAEPQLHFPFFYHDPIYAADIFPPSGILEGGTEVIIVGSGFSAYGQVFIARFLDAEVVCETVDSTSIKCFSPAIPSEQNLAGVERYFPDVAVPVQVTANRQQFTPLQIGVGCPPNPELPFDDNPRASCTQPFVMWTWYKNPSITSVGMADGSDVAGFNSQLNPDLYPGLSSRLGALTLPQGPTAGGTKVVIKGNDFISFARAQIVNGQNVVCPTGRPAPPGESCSTTCTFPFRHADPNTGRQELYYECINLQRLADQTSYDPSVYWCVVGGTAPATFSGDWGQCRYFINEFKDYLQGGKTVTKLQCLFGEQHVDAHIVDNSTITCDSPPNPHGVVVPLTVTLNGKDYALISSRTQFQYIAPAPVAVRALPNPQISEIRITFDVPTNKAGLLAADGVLRSDDVSKSGCSALLDDAFIATLGDNLPTCMWLPGSSVLSITPSNANPTFLLGDVVRFKRRACEMDDSCWDQRALDDLLAAPTARPGCVYSPTTQCNTNLMHSYEDLWCGRCHPAPNANVEVVSYPFNQSSLDLRISPPNTIISPVPIITGPNVVDSCLSLCMGGTLEGTPCQDDAACAGGGTCATSLVSLEGSAAAGRLGRAFQRVRWYVVPGSSSPDYAVVSRLGETMPRYTGLDAHIMWDGMPSEQAPNQHYCFGLEITNWLGAAANSSACHLVTRSDSAVAQVVVLGDMVRSATLSEELSLATSVAPSSCASNASTLTYAWDVRPEPPGWAASAFSKTRGSLAVPPMSVGFSIGTTYIFRLNATLVTPDQPDSVVHAEVQVVIEAQAPVARIQGGSYREVASADTLSLSAEGSYDQDVAMDNRHDGDLIYCWTCRVTSAHGEPPGEGDLCYFTNESYYNPQTGLHANASALSVPPGPLLTPGWTYGVTLHVAKFAQGRTCSDVWYGGVEHVSSARTTVSVSMAEALPEATIFAPDSAYLSADMTIRLSAFVAGSTCPAEGMTVELCAVSSYEWSLDGHSSVNNLNGASGLTGSSYGLVTLVIPPGRLIPNQPGNMYTFHLSVTDLAGASTTSTLSLEYNPGPSSGTFTATTTDVTGYALSSVWTLQADHWVDEHTPITYQFFYTATSYSDADESVITPVSVIALGGQQSKTSLKTVLPQGNLKNDNTMTLYVRVYDALGAMTEVSTNVKVLRDATSVEARGAAAKAAFEERMAELERSGDVSAIYTFIGIVGNVLGDPVHKQSRYEVEIGDIFSQIFQKLDELSRPSSSRRALATYTAVTSPSTVMSQASTEYSAISAKTSTLSASDCEPVVQRIRGQLAPLTITLGTTEADQKNSLDQLVWTLGLCQTAMVSSAQQQWDYVREAIQALLLNYLRGKSGSSYQTDKNGLAIFAIRGGTTVNDVATSATLAPDSTTIKYTNRILTGQSGLGTNVDVHAVAFNKATNPFDSSDTQTVSSRVLSLKVFSSLASGSSTVPTSVSPLSISGLSEAHKVEITLFTHVAPPAKNYNETTGIFTATVCSFWNTSSSTWIQFHTAYQVGDMGRIPCKTDHLTEFATVPGTVGCDSLASQTPAANNMCRVCGGGTPKPMQGICDWQGTPCTTSLARDRCGVCGGRNVSFTSDATRNVSGVCDYKGVACGVVSNVQEIPTVCGICANPTKRAETQRNAGICDCQGTGVPNGGKVLDRCQVCDGGNSSMDYCGHSPDIPVSLVCHTGGVDSTWNSSCTGCDGVPRPDKGLGGIKVDVCGVCGGGGQNCTGCDGVVSSNARADVCGVCKGTGLSCQGCDGVASSPPKQLDSCGTCGGANFGACDKRDASNLVPCNYQSLTPQYICRQGCDGESGSGSRYDRCGVCNGDNSTCFDIPECRANSPACPTVNKGCACSACADKWKALTKGCQCGVFQDACGKCGGDSTSCLGCDGKPMSGKVFDRCGQCDGDNSRCLGCDGVVNSGKKFDLCGVCDGGNAARDICGICGGDGSSCTGCDEKIYSGKATDACDVCGGTNRCKWRDGDPPASSQGNTDAVTMTLTIDRSRRRAGAGAPLLGEGGPEAWMVAMVAAAALSVVGAALFARAVGRWEEEALAAGEEA